MSILLTGNEMAELSNVFYEGFTGRVGMLLCKAQLTKVVAKLKSICEEFDESDDIDRNVRLLLLQLEQEIR